jgi:hypothetical protein
MTIIAMSVFVINILVYSYYCIDNTITIFLTWNVIFAPPSDFMLHSYANLFKLFLTELDLMTFLSMQLIQEQDFKCQSFIGVVSLSLQSSVKCFGDHGLSFSVFSFWPLGCLSLFDVCLLIIIWCVKVKKKHSSSSWCCIAVNIFRDFKTTNPMVT